MVYSPNLGNRLSSVTNFNLSDNSNNYKFFARVEYVVLDENSRFYEEYGKVDAISGIKFRILGKSIAEDSLDNLPFAYPGIPGFKTVPLVDEIVEIELQPSTNIESSVTSYIPYYTRILNIWNNSTHNAFPDTKATGTEARLGDTVEEKSSLRILQPFPGDVYMEGRLGQSLRFSGYNSNISPFSDDSNNGDPITILRNGQNLLEDVEKTSIEDINKDDSSIYLTTNHNIKLDLANKKSQSFRSSEDKPEQTEAYKGRQVLIDSGRVVINAKDDDLIVSSKSSTSINSKRLHLDGQDYIGLDSEKIYLGGNSFSEGEPIVLGGRNEIWLTSLLKSLENLATTLSVLPPSAAGISTLLVESGTSLLEEVIKLKTDLSTIKSNKTFTE